MRHATQASLPSVALKWPAAHVEHTRLDDALGAAVSYWPAAHVVMAWHTRSDMPVGAAKVYWPDGHVAECVAQSRSAMSVGATFSYSLARHVVTPTQALPSLAPEYVEPSTHAAHSRLVEADPALDWPKPDGHLDQAVQVFMPALSANVPLGQGAHARSLDAVGSAVVKDPAEHATLTSTHASEPMTSEKVAPVTHTAHWRSDEAVPSPEKPKPTAQVAQGSHVFMPEVAVNVPSVQAAQLRSVAEVGAAASYVPASHAALTDSQEAPSLVLENAEPARQAPQTRSAVAEPAVSWPWPATHAPHAAQELSPALAVK